jgi:uncharacterized protein
MSTALAERHSQLTSLEPARRSSAIYEGWVAHRRTSPVPHSFRYRIFLPLFDLDELPELLDDVPLWSARGRAPARFRRSDYLGDPAVPLAEAARDLVAERTGKRPAGPVQLLANPRYWGVGINPVAFYFLHGEAGVEAMIAEVTNTPWGDRRSYVLEVGPDGLKGNFDKRLHVSPFMPMEQSYEWSATEPGERLNVSIRNHEEGKLVFEASLALRRHEITPASMRGLLFRYPPMTISTIARIYWNAVKLKLKGAPYFSHPDPDEGAS